jgi:hypothetical protein
MSRSPSVAESASLLLAAALELLPGHEVRMVHARMIAEPGVEAVEEGLRRRVVAGHQHGDQHAVAQAFRDGDDPVLGAATPVAAVPDIVAARRAARAEEAALPLRVELRRRLVERGLGDMIPGRGSLDRWSAWPLGGFERWGHRSELSSPGMRGLDAAGSVGLMLGERPRGRRVRRTTTHSKEKKTSREGEGLD